MQDKENRTSASADPTTERANKRAPKLVVMIPCLNEEQTVADVVAGIPATIQGIGEIEVVVIDDGSTDATADRAREAGADVVRLPRNLGLGRAFQEAIREALARDADVAVNIDGDGQFDPSDIPRLIEPIIDGSAHMATASRFVNPDLIPAMPRIKLWGNRWVAHIVWLVTQQRFYDVSCGFRAFSRKALLWLNLFGAFTYTQETFLDLAYKGLTIVEVPTRVLGTRRHGDSRVAASIPRYAIRSARIMLRAAISYRPFRFFATVATLFFATGFGLLGFLVWHYLGTGSFSPHIWAGFVGSSFTFLGILTLVIGFIGDLLLHLRLNQEQILFLLKQSRYLR